jgi:transcriptional regulator with XRE-family HTH domain
MVRKVDGLEEFGFDIDAYRKRLRIMRQIVSGENQADFAVRVGLDPKRWNNYEQGYPIPRHVAMMLMQKIDMSIEWLWFGREGNLRAEFRDQVRALQELERQQDKRSQKRAPNGVRKPNGISGEQHSVGGRQLKGRSSASRR